jgi:branched-chain amino acid aminotransferase
LHYWTSVFEWIRFYKTDKGPAIFRLGDHIKRFFYSASVLNMDLWYSKEEIEEACKIVVKENNLENWYIRPIARYGYGKMWLNPKWAKINVEVSAWPWGKYLSEKPVRVVISRLIRLHPDSAIMEAKIWWYYVNSVFANQDALSQGYDEALLLDYRGYVAEWPGENIFFIKWNTLYTPKLGTILPGITRDTIINAVAPDLWFEVKEVDIKPEDLDQFEEAFFVWTAAEVTPIGSISYSESLINTNNHRQSNFNHRQSLNVNWDSTKEELENFTQKKSDKKEIDYNVDKVLKIRDRYMDIVHWKVSKWEKFLAYVE